MFDTISDYERRIQFILKSDLINVTFFSEYLMILSGFHTKEFLILAEVFLYLFFASLQERGNLFLNFLIIRFLRETSASLLL